MNELHKVAAFVINGAGPAQKLLTIDHPEAGWQLPAGTVEADEAPDTAVLRELHEEADLTDLVLVKKLAVFNQLSGPQRVMCQTAQLRSAPELDAPLLAHTCRRGWYVRELARQQDRVQVCYEEREHRNNRPGEVVLSWIGWVADTAVTAQLTRHLYHFRPTTNLPDEWFADSGDHGYPPWRLFWQPLATAQLVQAQQVWLDMVRDTLVSGNF